MFSERPVVNRMKQEAHGTQQITLHVDYEDTFVPYVQLDIIDAPFVRVDVIEGLVFLCIQSSHPSSNHNLYVPQDHSSSAGACPKGVTAAATPVKEPFLPLHSPPVAVIHVQVKAFQLCSPIPGPFQHKFFPVVCPLEARPYFIAY